MGVELIDGIALSETSPSAVNALVGSLEAQADYYKTKEGLWDVFTAKQEYNPACLDKYDRFLHAHSLTNHTMFPWCSEYLIKENGPIVYPGDKKFAVCLTHDVDCLKPANFCWIPIGRFTKALLRKASSRFDGAWNFKGIMELEERYGAMSSFYFMALDRDNLDFNYRIEEVREEIQTISDAGWEVGLHGGHEAFRDEQEIVKEKAALERVLGRRVAGYRNHFLRFEVPLTWEIVRKAGMSYDTSFGYADHVGFRNGMCHPYKPYNLKMGRRIDIVEIPLVLMDKTAFVTMGLEPAGVLEVCKSIIDVAERLNGAISLLWHNNYMVGDPRRLYEKIVRYCAERGAWMPTCADLCKWWRNNGPELSDHLHMEGRRDPPAQSAFLSGGLQP